MATIHRRCALLLAALPMACTDSNSSTTTPQAQVTDSLGYKYDVYCSDGLCGCTSLDSAVTAKSCAGTGGTDFFMLVPTPLLSIYAVTQSASGLINVSPALPSRPVVCASDADCVPSGVPSGMGNLTYACSHGLCRCTSSACETADGNPYTYNVLTLCQADIPWPAACPYITSPAFASRLADVAETCGSHETCATVPASCRQWTGPTPSIDGGVPGVDAGY